MDTAQVQNLKTYRVETKDDIVAATRLSKYYNSRPIQARRLDKLIHCDWWVQAELLTDISVIARSNIERREAVAFILLEETNIRNRTTDPTTDLKVSTFAVDPWFDPEVAVKWADYRIDQACEHLNRIDKVLWEVHERNVPVQLLLRDMRYKILDYDRSAEVITFTK